METQSDGAQLGAEFTHVHCTRLSKYDLELYENLNSETYSIS